MFKSVTFQDYTSDTRSALNFQVVAPNNEILHFRGDKDGVRWAQRIGHCGYIKVLVSDLKSKLAMV